MFIDTHAHIYHLQLHEDLDATLGRARAVGVDRILMPAIDITSIEQALDLCNRYAGLYAMSGLHPTEAKAFTKGEMVRIEDHCADPRVVAVGETGLDYYWDRSFDDSQKASLRHHAEIATRTGLPMVIHLRDKKGRDEVHQDAVRILRETLPAWDGERPRGVFHCFTGPHWLIAEAAELGFLLGIGGVITFKNAGVDKLLGPVPLSQCILETDAPYMAPAPHRGRRNEPAYLDLIARKLAMVKGISVADVGLATTQNAERLFRLAV